MNLFESARLSAEKRLRADTFFSAIQPTRGNKLFRENFCSRKNERIIFFLQEKRGKSRLLKPMLLLLLSLLLLQLKEEVAVGGVNLPTGRD